ncbi:MAG: glycosyltransferase involved in cell wall biosynthesis [Planctomycetota bacterium]|jgi:glycosyltransferase involved in cell wall biosynthesis
MSSIIQLSIVVPVFNEAESLPILHKQIQDAVVPMGITWELILVDDYSTDDSLEIMLELRRNDPHLRIVRFPHNYGQTAGLAAGFDVSRGEVVVTMDGDLQNDPADIPAMMLKMAEGYDVVAGWRKSRQDGFVLRRLPSIMANRLIGFVTGVKIHDTGCTLKSFRRDVVKRLPIYAEQHRFLPVMSAGSGARVTELVVNHRPRIYGESKYGIGRAWRVLLDLMAIKLIVQFSQRPLRYFGVLSLSFMAAGAIFACAGLWSLGSSGASLDENWERDSWLNVVVSISALIWMLMVFFALLGLLAELVIHASGMHKRSALTRIMNEQN